MKKKQKARASKRPPEDYEGDRAKWSAPTTWIGRLFRGAKPSHAWCRGKFREIGTSGLSTHTVYYEQCDVCGAVRHYRPEY